MKKTKRAISFLLCLIMLFGTYATGGSVTASAGDVSAYQILDRLAIIDSSGSAWYHSSDGNYLGNLKPGSKFQDGECWQYVLGLSRFVFNSNVSIPSTSAYLGSGSSGCGSYYRVQAAVKNCSYEEIVEVLKKSQPGDIIGFKNSKVNATYGHIMLVGNNTGKKITFYQEASGYARKDTIDLTVNGLKNLYSFGYSGSASFSSNSYGLSLFRCNNRCGQSEFVYTDFTAPAAVTNIYGLKSTYTVGETLSVSWSPVNDATGYEVYISDGWGVLDNIGNVTSYSYVLQYPGNSVYIYIISKNSEGSTEGTRYYFDVMSSSPSNYLDPVNTINGLKSTYTVGETMSISWNANGATRYLVYTRPNDSDWWIGNESYTNSYYDEFLSVGQYAIRIDSEDSAGRCTEGTVFYYKVVCSNHTPGTYQYAESAHPHYIYYLCSQCGTVFKSNETSYYSSCSTCNPSYTLTYNANGGTGAPQSFTGSGNVAISNVRPTRPDKIISPTEKYTYSFIGWSTNSSSTTAQYQPGDTIYLSTNITLFAVWSVGHDQEMTEIEQFTLTYNANGGSGCPASQTGNGNITLSSTRPSKSGYTFQGWATSSSATIAQYQPGATFNLTKNTTLYAVWLADGGSTSATYTLTYNANGGKNAPAKQTTTNGSLTLSSAKPTRSGFIFLGWATSSSATEARFKPGAAVTIKADVTLYAVWKVNPTASAKINVKSSATVEYRSRVKITTTASGLPSGYQLVICDGKNILVRGNNKSVTYDAGEMTTSKTYTVYVVNENGTTIQKSNSGDLEKDCEINVNGGFFAALIAFFKGLFGLLPTVEIKP